MMKLKQTLSVLMILFLILTSCVACTQKPEPEPAAAPTLPSQNPQQTFAGSEGPPVRDPIFMEDDPATPRQVSQDPEPDRPELPDLPSFEPPESLSDELASFHFSMDGDLYQLPMPVAALLEAGWRIEADEPEESLSYGQSLSADFIKGNKIVSTVVKSYGTNVQPLEYCHIIEIKFQPEVHRDYETPDIVMPSRITFSSSADDILRAYGEPTYQHEDTIRYDFEGENWRPSHVTFETYWNTGTIKSIDMDNDVAPEYTPETFDGEIPSFVTGYTRPRALGSDWSSFTMKIQGEVYALPMPVDLFLKDGWVIENNEDVDPDQVVPAKASLSSIFLYLVKDGEQIGIDVYNYADIGLPFRYCFVTSIISWPIYNGADIELPGGVMLSSCSPRSLQEAYGDPDDLDTYGDTTFYVYGKLDAWLSFDHNDSEGKIIGVDITHRPDKLPA